MFELVFDRAGAALLNVMYGALDQCQKLGSKWVCTEHVLIAMIEDEDGHLSIATQALASMSVNEKSALEIANHIKLNPDSEPLFTRRSESLEATPPSPGQHASADRPAFSQAVIDSLKRAEDYSIYFGSDEIEPEHLLLAFTDSKDAAAVNAFEELSVNLTFLRRQIIYMMARETFADPNFGGLRTLLVKGLTGLVQKHEDSVDALAQLGVRSDNRRLRLPARSELVHMVVISYLSEFLSTQVCFQRYLLEENIRSLTRRIGVIDRELSASIVTSAAQNLRAEVRATIEHMWCNEYRVLTQMLDEAEHDVIGSVIEDLWWAQSEEIALHESFAEAMEDHRRKHLLDVQKRRIELSQRIEKLQKRLDETIQKCFLKHPISA
jgi:ATP-dependent Clp protease ATP-binding subunit ClpA